MLLTALYFLNSDFIQPMSSRILSINGNKPMNYLLKTFLSQDYKIITASAVKEGIPHLKSEDIELIIVDLDMRTNENIDFIYYIRESWLFKKPFIVLSADKTIVDELSKDMFINSILKPFNPLDLVKMTAHLVNKQTTFSA